MTLSARGNSGPQDEYPTRFDAGRNRAAIYRRANGLPRHKRSGILSQLLFDLADDGIDLCANRLIAQNRVQRLKNGKLAEIVHHGSWRAGLSFDCCICPRVSPGTRPSAVLPSEMHIIATPG